MATITYNYAIGSEVFQVDETKGVLDAIVRTITISIIQGSTTISYNVAYKKPSLGSANVVESALYANVDAALAAYKSIVVV
jgi:hypothetical protein